MGILKTIKQGVIGATSDVLSAPAKLKAIRSKQQADSDVSTLKTARSYKSAPSMSSNGMPTDAFKARSLAFDVKDRLASKGK